MSSERKIFICTTFREFDGSINSKIQESFLESIRSQTYNNYKLIVTNFQEKTVEGHLSNSGIDFKLIQSKLLKYRYSWTETVSNCFDLVKRGKHIILWTNCDHIFSNNYFEEIINNFEEGFCGTSWPMLSYQSIDDYRVNNPLDNTLLTELDEYGEVLKEPWSNIYNNNIYKLFSKLFPSSSFYSYDPNEWIPDMFFMDGDNFLDCEMQDIFYQHKLNGRFQGIAQSLFFTAFSGNKKKQNLIYKCKVASIRNYRFPDE